MAFKFPYSDKYGNNLEECYVKIDVINIDHRIPSLTAVCGYYVNEEARVEEKLAFLHKTYTYYGDDYDYIFGHESAGSSAIHTAVYNKLAKIDSFIEADVHINELQYHSIHGQEEIGAELAKQIEELKKELEACKKGEGGEGEPNAGVLLSYVEEDGRYFLDYEMAEGLALGGFQFGKTDGANHIEYVASNGTEAGAQGFMVSNSADVFLGFSFSGSLIEGAGHLVELIDEEGNPIDPSGPDMPEAPLIIQTLSGADAENIIGTWAAYVPLGGAAKKADPDGESAPDKADREAAENEKIEKEAEAEAELEVVDEILHKKLVQDLQMMNPIMFEKPENSPWEEHILEITKNVHITRNYAQGLFNPRTELGFNGKQGGPGLTRWFSNDGEGIDTLTFISSGFKREDMTSWVDANQSSPPEMVGLTQVLYLEDHGLWFDIVIQSWQEGTHGSFEEAVEAESGGGFSLILVFMGDDTWYKEQIAKKENIS